MKFDEVVAGIREHIKRGAVLQVDRVRRGKKRGISVGPYQTAVGPRRYAVCIIPAPQDQSDCVVNTSPDRVAREFVRFVGTESAQELLRKRAR